MADLFGEEEDQQEMEEEDDDEEEEEDILDMGDDDGVQQQDVLLMRFCPHDSSMLYPKVRSQSVRKSVFDYSQHHR